MKRSLTSLGSNALVSIRPKSHTRTARFELFDSETYPRELFSQHPAVLELASHEARYFELMVGEIASKLRNRWGNKSTRDISMHKQSSGSRMCVLQAEGVLTSST